MILYFCIIFFWMSDINMVSKGIPPKNKSRFSQQINQFSSFEIRKFVFFKFFKHSKKTIVLFISLLMQRIKNIKTTSYSLTHEEKEAKINRAGNCRRIFSS